jgi:ABC-2 type transport system ATP-binding protein
MNDVDPVLEMLELSRDFNGRVVLQDVSLTVQHGEILALLGKNGVGKSTLLKLIAGLLAPSAGKSLIRGQESWPPSGQLNHVACVLDGMSPPQDVSVREIFTLKSCVANRFDHHLARSLCEQHHISLKSRWHTLSKGQKRWVLVVSAIASHAELLLLDEPADGLDVATRRELYELLRDRANKDGLSAVIASHIIMDVERVVDDVAILVEGRVRLHAPIEQLREDTCEVELHRDTTMAAIEPLAEVITSRWADDGVLAVVRFRSPELVEQTLPGETSRRHINLEDLYLAYTQPTVAVEPIDTIMA